MKAKPKTAKPVDKARLAKLEARVEELEREKADLARRVMALEARLRIGAQDAPSPSAEALIDPPSVGWGA